MPTEPHNQNQSDNNKRLQKNIDYWTNLTKSQTKNETYLALNQQYTMGTFLNTVTNPTLRKTTIKSSLPVEEVQHTQT